MRQAGAWVPAGGVSWLRSGSRELGALGQCAGLVVLDLVGECGVGGLCDVDLLADAPSGRGSGTLRRVLVERPQHRRTYLLVARSKATSTPASLRQTQVQQYKCSPRWRACRARSANSSSRSASTSRSRWSKNSSVSDHARATTTSWSEVAVANAT